MSLLLLVHEVRLIVDFDHGAQQPVGDSHVLQNSQHVGLLVRRLRVTDVPDVDEQILRETEGRVSKTLRPRTAHRGGGRYRRYRVFDVLQRGGEGVDELVGQLGQEADGVHVQDGHVTGQLAGVHGDVQRGEQLVPGLKAGVARQRFDQRRLSWSEDQIATTENIVAVRRRPRGSR